MDTGKSVLIVGFTAVAVASGFYWFTVVEPERTVVTLRHMCLDFVSRRGQVADSDKENLASSLGTSIGGLSNYCNVMVRSEARIFHAYR